jgi:RHS repeat-associated protein
LRGPDLTSLQAQSFDYDEYGNLIGTSKLGQTISLPPSSATNRLNTLHYDAAGNVDIAGTQYYSYDAVGMLNTVRLDSATAQPRVVYGYTADDERLFAFDIATNTTHWTLRGFDNKVLRDFQQVSSTWSLARDYVYRGDLLLAALKPAGDVEHYTLDHLGTPRLITAAAGHKIGYHVYWPFGEEWSPGNSQDGAPLKFTGHERDADPTGGTAALDYTHARYYGAGWGRFLSVDPVDGRPSLPQSWNRYAYVMNNPSNRTDPTGKCIWDFCIGEGTAAYAAGAALVAATVYVLAPSATVRGQTNGQVMVSTAVGGFQALTKTVGSMLPGRQPTTLPPPPPPTRPAQPSTPGTQPTTGINPTAPIHSNVVNTTQGPVTIPSDYTSRPADNGKGTVYQAPGATGNADVIRVMDPTTRYPDGYVRIYNNHGQPVNVDGQPLGPAETHLPILKDPPAQPQ